MAGFKPITHEDLKYRLNKLRCCFATKASELVDKQMYGKVCKDEMCNLKLLGIFIYQMARSRIRSTNYSKLY